VHHTVAHTADVEAGRRLSTSPHAGSGAARVPRQDQPAQKWGSTNSDPCSNLYRFAVERDPDASLSVTVIDDSTRMGAGRVGM